MNFNEDTKHQTFSLPPVEVKSLKILSPKQML